MAWQLSTGTGSSFPATPSSPTPLRCARTAPLRASCWATTRMRAGRRPAQPPALVAVAREAQDVRREGRCGCAPPRRLPRAARAAPFPRPILGLLTQMTQASNPPPSSRDALLGSAPRTSAVHSGTPAHGVQSPPLAGSQAGRGRGPGRGPRGAAARVLAPREQKRRPLATRRAKVLAIEQAESRAARPCESASLLAPGRVEPELQRHARAPCASFPTIRTQASKLVQSTPARPCTPA